MTLEKGLVFLNTKLLQKALTRYSVHRHFDYMYLKNDKIRVEARCMEDDCEFSIFTSKMRDFDGIQIKSFISKHMCGASYENRICNVEFLVHQYLQNLRDQPNWSIMALRGQIR